MSETAYTRDDLRVMSPAAVVAAHREGQLDHLLRPAPPTTDEPSVEDTVDEPEPGLPTGSADQGARGERQTELQRLRSMRPDQIVEAMRRDPGFVNRMAEATASEHAEQRRWS